MYPGELLQTVLYLVCFCHSMISSTYEAVVNLLNKTNLNIPRRLGCRGSKELDVENKHLLLM